MPGLRDMLGRWVGGAKPPPPPAATAPAAAAPKKDTLSVDDPRLPSASRDRMARLLALVADINARSEANPALATAHAEVRQMHDVHIPHLLQSYAEIPPQHRAEIFRRTGKSASYNLNAGLDRMIARLEEVSRSLAEGDIDSFADNLRFIEHRYGREDPLG